MADTSLKKLQEKQKKQNTKNTSNKSNKKTVKTLDAALYETIAKEYSQLNAKDKTPDKLYDIMMNKGSLDGVSRGDINVFFSDIEKKGFSVDHLQSSRILDIEKFISPKESEEKTINGTLKQMAKTFEGNQKALFDDFKTQMRLGGSGTTIYITKDSACKSITDLQEQRAAYVLRKKIEGPEVTTITNLIARLGAPGSPTDQTNKRVTQAAIKKIAQRLPTKELQKKREVRYDLPIDAYSQIKNLRDLQSSLNHFITLNRADFTDQQWQAFSSIIVSNGDILQEAKYSGHISDSTDGNYKERGSAFKTMFNKLVTAQALEKVQQSKERLQEQTQGIHTVMQELAPHASKITESILPNKLELVDPSIQENTSQLEALQEKKKRVISQLSQAKKKKKEESVQEENPQLKIEIEQIQEKKKAIEQDIQQQNLLVKKKQRDAYLHKVSQSDASLAEILKKASQPDGFDFARLSKAETTYYLHFQLKKTLDGLFKQGVHTTLGLSEHEFSHYIMDLYDTNKSQLTIPTSEGDITLNFSFKGIQPGSRLSAEELSPAKFATWSGGKFHVGIQIENQDKEEFLREVVAPSSWTKFNGVDVHEGEFVHIVGPDGQTLQGYLSNISDAMLVDPNGTAQTQKLHDKHNARVLTTTPTATVADTRSLVNDPQTGKPWMVYGDNMPGQPQQTTTPGTKESDRKIIDKDYSKSNLRLTGDEINNLTTAYMIGQQSITDNKLPKDDLKELAKRDEAEVPKDTYVDTHQNNPDAQQDELVSLQEEKETTRKEFMDKRKTLQSGTNCNASNQYGFQKGTKIYLTDKKAQGLPRSPGATFTAQITDIDEVNNTWTIKMAGTKQSLSDHEGKTKTMNMDQQSLTSMTKLFSDVTVVADEKTKDIEQSHASLMDAGMVEDQPIAFSKLKRNNKKGRTNQSEKEDYPHFTDGKNVITMKPSGSDHVKVESSRLKDIQDGKAKPGDRPKKGKFSYNKSIDFPSFWLMVNGGKRRTMSQSQYNQHKQDEKTIAKKQNSPKDSPKGRGWFSFSNLVGAAKNVFSKIDDKMKEYDKEKTDDFLFNATNKGSLIRTLAGGARALGIRSIEEAIDQTHLDIYGEKSDRVFKKITKRKDAFNKHDDTGEKTTDLVWQYLKGESKPARQPYKAAGALLFMMDVAGGPYARNLVDKAGTGFRTEMLLGPAAKAKLIKETKELENDLKRDPTNMNKLKEYADKEMNFIQISIDGGDQSLKDFYGVKFADTIAETKYKMFGEDGVKKKFDFYVGERDFSFAYQEFNANAGKMIMDKTIGSLKAMMELASNDDEKRQTQECFALAMLSGLFLNNTNYTTKESIHKMATRIGFAPGLRVKGFDQQEKTATIFDFVTNGALSKDLGFDVEQHGRSTYGKNLKEKLTTKKDKDGNDLASGTRFSNRWGIHGKNIMDFLELKNINEEPEKSLIALAADTQEGEAAKKGPGGRAPNKQEKVLLKSIAGELNSSKNSSFEDMEAAIFNDSPFTIPATVIQNKFSYSGNTYRSSNDESMLRVIQDFWSQFRDNIPKGENISPEVFYFVVEKASSYFDHLGDTSNNAGLIQRIFGAVRREVEKGGTENLKEADMLIDGAILGLAKERGVPLEVRKALEAFSVLLKNNKTLINKTMIGAMFAKDKETAITNFSRKEKYLPRADFMKKPHNERRNATEFPMNKDLYAKDQQMSHRTGIGLFEGTAGGAATKKTSDQSKQNGIQSDRQNPQIKVDKDSQKPLQKKIAEMFGASKNKKNNAQQGVAAGDEEDDEEEEYGYNEYLD